MAEIKIKDGSAKDFELLFSLSQETLTLLIDNLKKVEPGLSPQKAAERLQETIHVDDLEAIVRLIYGINQLRLSSELSAEKVADDLLNALEPMGLENFNLDLSKNYLLDILNVEGATSLTIMATNSIYTREKILMDADIVTDLRPVFNESQLKGLVVIHTLKIDFMDNTNDNPGAIFLALDNDDMDKLEKIIQRAKARASSLKSDVSSSTFIDLV